MATKAAVYDQFDRAFSTTTGYAIIHKGEAVGRVVLKHGNQVSAYVQIWGAAMQKGIARGGNYDRATAAVEVAVAKMTEVPHAPDARAAMEALRHAFASAVDGTRWTDTIEKGGMRLALVIG